MVQGVGSEESVPVAGSHLIHVRLPARKPEDKARHIQEPPYSGARLAAHKGNDVRLYLLFVDRRQDNRIKLTSVARRPQFGKTVRKP